MMVDMGREVIASMTMSEMAFDVLSPPARLWRTQADLERTRFCLEQLGELHGRQFGAADLSKVLHRLLIAGNAVRWRVRWRNLRRWRLRSFVTLVELRGHLWLNPEGWGCQCWRVR